MPSHAPRCLSRTVFAAASAFALLALVPWAPAQSNWGVAADKRGMLYFCDIQRDRVWRYDPQGHLDLLLDHNHCHTLVLGYDAFVYGENVGGESRAGGVVGVWRLTPEGERTFLLAPTATPDPATWLVRDSAGNTYAWNGNPQAKGLSRILKRTPQGETLLLAGDSWGFADGLGNQARFGEVAGMAAAPDGTLYVADGGNLRRVSPDGTVKTLARGILSTVAGGLPGIGGLYNHHMGVATDSQGTVYVVDYGRRHILRWDPIGGARTLVESRGVANWLTRGSWGWRPTGVAVASDCIYIMEDWSLPTFAADVIGNPRLRRISPDRHITTVVTVSSLTARAIAAVVLAVLAIGFLAWRRSRKKLTLPRLP